jgi:hypothetical protein
MAWVYNPFTEKLDVKDSSIRYLKLNGSNENTNLNISPYHYVTTGRYYTTAITPLPTVDGITWAARKKLTATTKPSSTLSNYTHRVAIVNDAQIGARCLSSGYDIRFTASDGTTLLAYKREYFAISGGLAKGEFWVMMPSVSSSSNAIIYIYYGNATAPDVSTNTNVWDSNTIRLFYMKNLTGAADGEDAKGYDLTNYNATATTGKIGGANSYAANQYQEGATTNLPSGASSRTYSFWYKTTDYSNQKVILSYGTSSGDQRIMLYYQSGYIRFNTNAWELNRYVWNIFGSWTRIDWTYDGTVVKLYTNGAYTGPTGNRTLATTTTNGLDLSKLFGASSGWALGQLDHVMISDIVRSDAWIAYDYTVHNSSSANWTWDYERVSNDSFLEYDDVLASLILYHQGLVALGASASSLTTYLPVNASISLTTPSLTVSSAMYLTGWSASRIPYITGSSGLLTNSANLTFSGSQLYVNSSISVAGYISVPTLYGNTYGAHYGDVYNATNVNTTNITATNANLVYLTITHPTNPFINYQGTETANGYTNLSTLQGVGAMTAPLQSSGANGGWTFHGMIKIQVKLADESTVERWVPDYTFHCGYDCEQDNCTCNTDGCGADCACNTNCPCNTDAPCTPDCPCNTNCSCDADCNCNTNYGCGADPCAPDCACNTDCFCNVNCWCNTNGCGTNCTCNADCACNINGGCGVDPCAPDCPCNMDGCGVDCACNADCFCNANCACNTDCNCNINCGCDGADPCGPDCPCNTDCTCNYDYSCCEPDCTCNVDCVCNTNGCGANCVCFADCTCNQDN